MGLPFNNPNATPADVQRYMGLVKEREKGMKRNAFSQSTFRGFWFALLACILYFVMIGFPLWDGVVYKFWKVAHLELPWWGSLFFVGWAAICAWPALIFCRFENTVDDPETRDASETCLIIPAYKAADALRDTIPHALKIFKPEQIFIIANGGSPTPMDNTEEVCKEFGVNHFWVPIGSKIIAEFIGVFLAKKYKYCILTDDDVHLPSNLPIVSDRITGNVACVGYSIKSTGANGSKGTVFQQAQDMEYKLAGLTKTFASKYGSATFPHGAIILWDRKILETLFFGHPGYTISEDWYFGHTARCLGHRVDFCTQVFVETETPPCFLIPTKSVRGGYGEMTIFSQRFYRWNFFFLYRLMNDLSYLIFAWRLGWREFLTKLYVFEEVWGSLIYVVLPFMMPIMWASCWEFTLKMTAGILGIYVVSFVVFNAVHLRLKKETIAWKIMPVYFAMKLVLVFVNSASVWYSMYAYAKYFSVKHSRVVDKHDVLQVLKDLLAAQAQKDAAYEAEQESLIHPGKKLVVEPVAQTENEQQEIGVAIVSEKHGEVPLEHEVEMMPQAEAIRDVDRRRSDDMLQISHIMGQYS
ncbi:hypothetical protein VTL71DRAFT_16330 [Oculimacula yallundae]|uniref:Uncharacterized protein n=1 Tax=Oculimacula yallundae TaxID=86028 RepID=A0ABR4CEU7_9HELO